MQCGDQCGDHFASTKLLRLIARHKLLPIHDSGWGTANAVSYCKTMMVSLLRRSMVAGIAGVETATVGVAPISV